MTRFARCCRFLILTPFALHRLMRHVEALPVDYCKLTDEHVDALGYLMGQYQKYRDDLLRLRADAKRFRVGLMEQVADTGLLPDGFADLEAEITYMRIRELRPEKVMELSPNCGWSTHYLLSALRDNGAGELHSYDLVDCSLKGESVRGANGVRSEATS